KLSFLPPYAQSTSPHCLDRASARLCLWHLRLPRLPRQGSSGGSQLLMRKIFRFYFGFCLYRLRSKFLVLARALSIKRAARFGISLLYGTCHFLYGDATNFSSLENEYTPTYCLQLEAAYGEDMMSEGGIEGIEHMFN